MPGKEIVAPGGDNILAGAGGHQLPQFESTPQPSLDTLGPEDVQGLKEAEKVVFPEAQSPVISETAESVESPEKKIFDLGAFIRNVMTILLR